MKTLALVAALVLLAQNTPPAPPPKPQDEQRDPTEGDAKLRELLRSRTVAPAAAVSLKALVVSKGKPGSALLEIDGRLHRVEEGASIGGFKIASLRSDGVRIEVALTGQVLVLR